MLVNLKPSHYVNVAATKGNQMVRIIKSRLNNYPESDLDTCHTFKTLVEYGFYLIIKQKTHI